ncbi:hypothetical protein TrLO_g15678 [Triparma laevis f. longispina]|uniref:Uncharacterized protein n=1 Tax=Triparma laevis f. longispina TaxID=1714387 RepID=A0A9W7L0U0_9STRA|nr:hypothetical protein TrLO_g15678 [Triparma laevis f. longispina]
MSSMMSKLQLHASEKSSLTSTITSLSDQVSSLQSSLTSRLAEIEVLKNRVEVTSRNNSILKLDNAQLIQEVERNNLLITELDEEASSIQGSSIISPHSPQLLKSYTSKISKLETTLHHEREQHNKSLERLEEKEGEGREKENAVIVMGHDLREARRREEGLIKEIEQLKRGETENEVRGEGELERMEAVNRNLNKGFYVREMAMREEIENKENENIHLKQQRDLAVEEMKRVTKEMCELMVAFEGGGLGLEGGEEREGLEVLGEEDEEEDNSV